MTLGQIVLMAMTPIGAALLYGFMRLHERLEPASRRMVDAVKAETAATPAQVSDSPTQAYQVVIDSDGFYRWYRQTSDGERQQSALRFATKALALDAARKMALRGKLRTSRKGRSIPSSLYSRRDRLDRRGSLP